MHHKPSITTIFTFLSILPILTSCVIAPGSRLKPSTSDAEKLNYELIEIDRASVLQEPVDFRLSQTGTDVNEGEYDRKIYEYRIGVQDVLNIQVWNHPELSSTSVSNSLGPLAQRSQVNRMRRFGNSALDQGFGATQGFSVDSHGRFFFPYVGEVHAEGETIESLRKTLTKKLSQFVQKPQVSIRVREFNSQKVQILGEVVQPGPMAITNKPTQVLSAIALAGGLTASADRSIARLVRNNGHVDTINLIKLYAGDLRQNFVLKDGDVLHIDTNRYRQILILGEVGKVAALPYDARGMSLNDALVAAGGLDQRYANAKGIYVLRNQTSRKKAQIFRLNLANASSILLADRFPLQARDVVYVDTSGIARWGRIVNQLLPSLRFLDDAARFQ